MSSRSSSNSYSPPVFPGLFNIGWIKSAHGIRGELFLRTHAGRADWSEDTNEIAILPNGKSAVEKFEILEMNPHKDGWILKLKGVRDRNHAEALAKSAVYIDETLLEEDREGEQIYLKQIQEFEVIDPKGVKLGVIRSFSTNGLQDLLVIETVDGREGLIPLVDAFLVHIDFDKKQVTMDLPPGLLGDEE